MFPIPLLFFKFTHSSYDSHAGSFSDQKHDLNFSFQRAEQEQQYAAVSILAENNRTIRRRY